LESDPTWSEREDSKGRDGLSTSRGMHKGICIGGEGGVVQCVFGQCEEVSGRDQAVICTRHLYCLESDSEG
jgi:hypothetical protein